MAMIVDVRGVPPEGRSYEGEEPPAALELAPDDEAAAAGPLRYAVRAQLAGSDLVVRGRVEAAVRFTCSRCTEEFVVPVSDPDFIAVHDTRGEASAGAGGEPAPAAAGEARPGARQDEAEQRQFVDLTPDMRESILLAFPSHPVCRPDCRGLCPQCGANRNKEACDCRPPGETQWGVLDGLNL